MSADDDVTLPSADATLPSADATLPSVDATLSFADIAFPYAFVIYRIKGLYQKFKVYIHKFQNIGCEISKFVFGNFKIVYIFIIYLEEDERIDRQDINDGGWEISAAISHYRDNRTTSVR